MEIAKSKVAVRDEAAEITAEEFVAPMLDRGPVTLAMLDAGYEVMASNGYWVDSAFIEWLDVAADRIPGELTDNGAGNTTAD